jgi:hypothetical protein
MKGKLAILSVGLLITAIVSFNASQEGITYHPEFRTDVPALLSHANAYPPAVGILSNSKNCVSCHANNGPWKDDSNTIIDIVDKDTKVSLKQVDGTFLIETKKNEARTVLTIIGSKKNNIIPASYRNAWLYIDPSTIETNTLSKFPANWEVNLPMSCRVVGDKLAGYEDADITSLPMTVLPRDNAKDAELSLQVMLTKGEAMKGNAQLGMTGSYFERNVKLKVK